MRFLRFLSSAILCFQRFPQDPRRAQPGARLKFKPAPCLPPFVFWSLHERLPVVRVRLAPAEVVRWISNWQGAPNGIGFL
ncbi:MAG TPA: hypothetical protein DC058_04840 [Planctomycetaceae bacterium]|nr:hypothetical protein [Planctomycetaceae bacterium]